MQREGLPLRFVDARCGFDEPYQYAGTGKLTVTSCLAVGWQLATKVRERTFGPDLGFRIVNQDALIALKPANPLEDPAFQG